MAKKIYFTSLKGGTGVTTCAYYIARALALTGERVMLVDGDAVAGGGLYVAGLENAQVYTLADFEQGACRAKQTLLSCRDAVNLCVMPSLGAVTKDVAVRAVAETEGLFDYVICDKTALAACDEAVIVAEPYAPSLKSADCCRAMLADGGMKKISVAVNKLSGAQVIDGDVVCAEEAAALLRLSLIAVIPEDLTLPVGGIKPATLKAFAAAAQAIGGKSDFYPNVLKPYYGIHGYFKRRLRDKV